MVCYIICGMIGACFGATFMALCVAGKREDEALEKLNRRNEQ